MRAAAQVLEVRSDRARLACVAAGPCEACRGGRGCALRWLSSGTSPSLEVASLAPDGSRLTPGQAVTIEVPPDELLLAAARMYLLPAAGLVVGPALARWVAGAGEGGALLAAATGLALGWWLARRWIRHSPPRYSLRIEPPADAG